MAEIVTLPAHLQAARGTRRVSLLRHPVDLDPEVSNGLRLWAIANDLPAENRWPVIIDWVAKTITHGPGTALPLQQIPRGRLWPALIAAGAVWCADPDHTTGGYPCPHKVDSEGQHAPNPPADAEHAHVLQAMATPGPHLVDSPLELLITTAIHRAAGACEHPDPGQPIYESDRACAQCAAAAVLALFQTADAIHILQTRALAQLTDCGMADPPPLLAAGRWEVGYQAPGHPPGYRPLSG